MDAPATAMPLRDSGRLAGERALQPLVWPKRGKLMKILLYNPDNGITQNFMPHLWMLLLQTLTTEGHEVVLIDGNTRPMSDAELVKFAVDEQIGLVGIGAMTRMVAKAYR